MGLQEFTDATGQVRLFTQSGRSLVSGVSVSSLSYTTTPYMTANETYPGTISGTTINGTATDITADITTGKLGAHIQMRDEQLPAIDRKGTRRNPSTQRATSMQP